MGTIELKNKRILVTGGNGYLGRHLVERLKGIDADVYIMDKFGDASAKKFILDITDLEVVKTAIAKIQPEIIFHLAASLNRERSFDRFDDTNNVNLNGTKNLLFALQNTEYQHFIFTSTSEVYGSNIAPFVETQLVDAASPYSLTKVFAENFINTFSKTYDKGFTILRLFNFFGRNMSPKFFIPQMVNTFRKDEKFEMTEGEQKRDFLYLDDVISAMVLAARQPATNEIYNVCSGHAVSLKELVLEVKKKLNSQSEIVFGALPYRENEVWNMVGDNTKIQKKLGFKPQYNLAGGIEQMLK